MDKADKNNLFQKLTDMDVKSDYHIHSNFSGDGVHSVKEILHNAYKLGLKRVSITDHDCIDGTEVAISIASSESIEVISGVELTTYLGNAYIHILGYGFPLTGEKNRLYRLLQKINQSRISNIDAVVEKIHHMGLFIDPDKLIESTGSRAPMVSTYSKLLLEDQRNSKNDLLKPYRKGGKKEVNGALNFAIDYMLYGSPLYVEEYKITMEEGVEAIVESGGVAVVAHPGLWFREKHKPVLKPLIERGLMGMEVYTPYHTKEQILFYEKIAKEYELYPTHGSDYHGISMKPKNKLGIFEACD